MLVLPKVSAAGRISQSGCLRRKTTRGKRQSLQNGMGRDQARPVTCKLCDE
jgi:hypothetical protein